MSDYEYEDDYQFEYEDDGGAYEEGGGAGGTADPVVRIQNSYYQAKGLVANDPAAAKTHFQECLAAADEAGRGFQEWAFKSAKNLVKLSITTGDPAATITARYKDLLGRVIRDDVTRNKAEKAVHAVLDLMGAVTMSAGATAGAGAGTFSSAAAELYTLTLATLEGRGAANERLCFKTRMKLARIHAAQGAWDAVEEVLNKHEALTAAAAAAAGAAAGQDEQALASQGLEAAAIRLALLEHRGDTYGAAEVAAAALRQLHGAVAHPAITGAVYEGAARVAMRERRWEAARQAAFDAFKLFQEASAPVEKVTSCLRLLTVAAVLAGSRINHFGLPETRAYEAAPAVAPLTRLFNAYMAADGAGVQEAVAGPAAGLLTGDDFLRPFYSTLVDALRAGVLAALLKPYHRVTLDWLAVCLNESCGSDTPPLDAYAVEALVVTLVNERGLVATVDAEQGLVYIGAAEVAAHPPLVAVASAATSTAAGRAAFAGVGGEAEEGGDKEAARVAPSALVAQLGPALQAFTKAATTAAANQRQRAGSSSGGGGGGGGMAAAAASQGRPPEPAAPWTGGGATQLSEADLRAMVDAMQQ